MTATTTVATLPFPLLELVFLLETTKWAKFLAILGFIGIGFMVIGGLIVMSVGGRMAMYGGMSGMNPGLFGIIYLVMAGLYVFPVLYLYRFATITRDGLDLKNSENVNKGLENLKSHYKFMGILAIVIISIYVLMFLGGIVAGIAMAA